MLNRIVFRMLPAVVALAVGAGLWSGLGAEGEVMFSYRYEVGQSDAFKLKFNMELETMGFARTQFVDMEVTEICVGVTEDLFKMEMRFDKVESSVMFFEKLQEDKMGENLTGQSVSYEVNRHGKVDKIQDVGVIDGWAEIEQSVKQILQMWYPYLPGEGVAEGGNWADVDSSETDDMRTIANTKYLFKEPKKEKGRECAQVKADINFTMSGTQSTPMGVFQTDGRGEGKNEFFFDPETFAIVKSKGTLEIHMDMTPEAGGDGFVTTVNFEMQRELK